MSDLEKLSKKFRLPNPTTQEDLECRLHLNWNAVLKFGDKVLLAGYYYPGYFGAVYEFLSDDHTCEGAIGLCSVSDICFTDEGHAIQWAMNN